MRDEFYQNNLYDNILIISLKALSSLNILENFHYMVTNDKLNH